MKKNHLNRRHFIHKCFALASGLLFPNALKALNTEGVKDAEPQFTNNPNLPTILPFNKWKGTPLDAEGRFVNHEFPHTANFKKAMKWMLFTKNPQKKEKKEDTFSPEVIKGDAFIKNTENTVVWLGHASFYVCINGYRILIDPVFDDIVAVKRRSEMPCKTAAFTNIDYILISHCHYDHCDKKTIKELIAVNPTVKILTGLGMEKLMQKWTPTQEIQTAGWYQQYKTPDNLEIVYLPSRHWSNRKLKDKNTRLWGAFVIKSVDKTIYFGGDSGYGSHFKEVGELYPNIDVAMIGAGAYSPRWFLHPMHQDPADAVKSFNEMKAKVMIPMHYGTFLQTDEPASEPETLIRQLIAEGKNANEVKILKIGEVLPY